MPNEAVDRVSSVVAPGLRGEMRLSVDPIAVFAALYDLLSSGDSYKLVHQGFLDSTRDPLKLSLVEAEFRQRFAVINEDFSAITIGVELLIRINAAIEILRGSPRDTDAISEIAMSARAVDAAFGGIGLVDGTAMLGRLLKFQDRLARKGNLLDSPMLTGHVLPMSRIGKTGNTLPQLFANLVRVPDYLSSRLNYSLLPAIGRVTRSGQLRIGVAPVVVDPDDVVWRRQGLTFGVGLNPDKLDAVRQRLLDVLNWFAEKRVDVVVLPELVSAGSLRETIKQWMRRSRGPALILAGTEAVSVEAGQQLVNRAFVFGRPGEAVWHQDKVHRYTFRQQDIARWRLATELGSDPLDEESYSNSNVIQLRDIPGVGRCMILICQDLAEPDPCQAIAIQAGVDFILSPVMDVPSQPNGWWARHAVNLAQNPGSTTIVANSFALLSRVPEEMRSRLALSRHEPMALVRGRPTDQGRYLDCLEVYPAEPGEMPLGAIFGASDGSG